MAHSSLPKPGSAELEALPLTAEHRRIYEILFERREDPPTMQEIRDLIGTARGKRDEHVDRRKRELHRFFDIRPVRVNGRPCHQLLGWADIINSDAVSVNRRIRYQIIQGGRCAKCGRTADRVEIVVDHVIPRRWGGTNHVSNLQPLCVDCNAGKKDYIGQFSLIEDRIRLAVSFDEPHRRIGEMLRAFDRGWVPSDLLGAVASAKQYQDDWQKRTRELRVLGWKIVTKRFRPAGERTQTFYRATHAPLLPSGDVAAAIRKLERTKPLAWG